MVNDGFGNEWKCHNPFAHGECARALKRCLQRVWGISFYSCEALAPNEGGDDDERNADEHFPNLQMMSANNICRFKLTRLPTQHLSVDEQTECARNYSVLCWTGIYENEQYMQFDDAKV